jgi:RNA polymerase sigma-70 factor (ECF subfamily)
MSVFLYNAMSLLAMVAQSPMRNEEDRRLLVRVKNGDQAAFAELYDRYSPLVFSLVVRIVKETAEAEDVLQEIFFTIWNKATLFNEEKGSVYTWIVTIARRKAIDRLRSKELVNRGERMDEELVGAIPDAAYMANPLNAAIGTEYEAMLRSAMELLSDQQRTVIELSYYEGYTQEQISKRLNLPLGTVKTRMRQGLMKLRENLEGRLR